MDETSTAAEHLQWCKDRALAYLGPVRTPSTPYPSYPGGRVVRHPDGRMEYEDERLVPIAAVQPSDIQQAFASFVSDMNKHDGTRDHVALPLGNMLFVSGHLRSESQMRHWIEGFQ